MKTILATGTAAMLMAATSAQAQRAPRVEYQTVPSTVVVTTTTNWQGPPPPPQAGPVYGDPYIPYAPVPVDAEVFAGLRVEAQVGFDRLQDEAPGFVFSGNGSGRNGVSYGGEIGYDVAVGTSLLLGGYVGAEGSTIEQCEALLGGTQCLSAGRSFTAGGRIGVTLSPFTLLYAKGGYTNARIRTDESIVVPGGVLNRFTDDLDGFHVGGGLETTFGRRAYGKIEYSYSRLRDLPIGILGSDPVTIDLNRHQVRAGVGLRL